MASLKDRFLNKCLEKTNVLFGPTRRLFINTTDFTIISNNCWGGKVYRYFKLPYNSPTVGLYFYPKDYLRFISDIKHYMNLELEFISYEQSKYSESLKSKGQTNIPIGKLDDVEIVFLHYKDAEEARVKWNRRKARINWSNVYYKFTEMNGCSMDDLKAFEKLKLERKVLFVSEDYGLHNQIIFKEFQGLHNVPDDTTRFKYINPIKFINCKL